MDHKVKPVESIKPILQETIFIYHSSEDGCWIGHGLRTDQIGVGGSIIEALADAIRAIHSVLQVAHDDPTVAYLREAPREIQEQSATAPLLPKEIFEIAHRRVLGNWPDELPVDIRPDNSRKFVAKITELEDAACYNG